jgi:hypothetical protein
VEEDEEEKIDLSEVPLDKGYTANALLEDDN